MSQDLNLALCQRFVAHVLGELRGYLRRNTLLAQMDLPNHINQFLWRHVLEHVASSSGFHGSLDLDITLEGRQHDDASAGKLRSDCDQSVNAAHIGKPEVHECDIGPMLAELLDGLAPARGLSRQEHVGLAVDNRSDSLPQKRMVI